MPHEAPTLLIAGFAQIFVDSALWGFIAFFSIGFLAQLVDGALGMAYGIISSTLMLCIGMPPQTTSATVHAAEVFTTGASGISHSLLGNVDFALMWRLALPGICGGAAGALLLNQLQAPWLKPLVAFYLLCVGALILFRALKPLAAKTAMRSTPRKIGLVAGFLDAVGGGGWGTLTSGSLIAQNHPARIAIGSANAAEFFVTITITALLFKALAGVPLAWLAGLITGGVFAAPIAALISRRIPERPARIAVGSLIILLCVPTFGAIL
jgi:uncharacterized protein